MKPLMSYRIFYRIQNLPEDLPKINFEFYKTHLASPALAAEFEKLVSMLQWLTVKILNIGTYMSEQTV